MPLELNLTIKGATMNLHEKYKSEVKAFVKVCHRLAKNMYVTGYGGNLAWKLKDDLLLITPTQMNKGTIKPKDVVFINLAGDILEGDRRPTGEMSEVETQHSMIAKSRSS